jgi:hypothetical protein
MGPGVLGLEVISGCFRLNGIYLAILIKYVNNYKFLLVNSLVFILIKEDVFGKG